MSETNMTSTLIDGALGDELRRWRTLRQVSQLDLALLAGTTQRHLSYIERGRSVPGRGMVVRLAEALDLPLRERNALLLAGGYAPVYPESTLGDESLRSVRQALEAILKGHEPYPAMIINRAGELIAANTACGLFFEDVDPDLLTEPINTRRLALHPDGLAGRITNFQAWAPHVTDGLRRECARNPDPTIERVLTELEGYVPKAPAATGQVGFAVPMELATPDGLVRLITTLTSFANATDVFLSEIRLEAFLPADGDSADRLRHRATSATPEQDLNPSALTSRPRT